MSKNPKKPEDEPPYDPTTDPTSPQFDWDKAEQGAMNRMLSKRERKLREEQDN